MKDILALIAVLVVVGLALAYIIKSKKKGVKCIGCPHSGDCGKCGGK